jgi:hypothetical protein
VCLITTLTLPGVPVCRLTTENRSQKTLLNVANRAREGLARVSIDCAAHAAVLLPLYSCPHMALFPNRQL